MLLVRMRRLFSKHSLPVTILLTVIMLLLCLTPQAIYAFSNFGENASKVIGQTTFTTSTKATTQSGLNAADADTFDSHGNMWVADVVNNRVLEFKPPFSDGMNAALVIGQASFTSSTAATTQSGLNDPVDLASDSHGNLWVTDSGNNR